MESPRSDTNEKEDVRRFTKLLEESMQEAHELRSRLQISEKCVEDYEAELEALQQDAFQKDQLHALAIREIEEEKSNALKDAEERILNWQLEYQAISEKLAGVQKELEEKLVKTKCLTEEKNETASLYNELQETMEALTMSSAACNQQKELITVLQTDKRELAQHIEMLEEDLLYYKENLSILKVQLSAQTEEFKEIQEQLAVTQSELAALKATPNVKSRGNSLFAEVEDNRQQMAKDYKLMLAKFGYMKKDYSAKCSEISKLKKEKAILVDKLEIAEREAKKHYKAFVENYEIRIKELQMTINHLKNDVKPVYLNGNDNILKFAEQTVVNSRKEILSLREEMEMRSALRLNEAAELLKTRGELAQARADLRKSSLKIKELTAALNERGTAQPAITVSDSVTPEEKRTIKTEIFETNAVAKLRTAFQKPKEVVFKEELLHDKFNSRKKNVKIDSAVREDPCIEEMKASEDVDEMVATLNEPMIKMEVADESSRDVDRLLNEDGIDGIKNDDKVGAQEILDDQELKIFSLGNGETEGKMENTESFMGEECVIRREDIDELIDEDSFTAALIRSPSSSVSLEREELMKIESVLDVNPSPIPSDGKNYIKERTQRPVNKRHSDNITCNVSPTSVDSLTELLSSDSSMCGEIHPSILKVRTNCSFENTEGNVNKEVKFDKDVKKNAGLLVESSGIKQEKEDETNKENSAGGTDNNDREESKPIRRRPRPKQSHPIIYMT